MGGMVARLISGQTAIAREAVALRNPGHIC